ncbi:MAG: RluA family pseudouridine synthase [Burkholderiales bacterium]|nr:MAG: RluA family pseudouridine synthase [Burkholderiales bacterium]
MNGLDSEAQNVRQPVAFAVRELRVDAAHAGQRLDNILIGLLKGVPKSRIYRMVRSGEVRVNKHRARADYRVQAQDLLRLPPVRTGERSVAQPPPITLQVLFEDDALLAIDKPAGLAVHGGSGVSHGVIEHLRASRPQARFLELAHRLDRETSGVLLIAKRRSALLALHAQLREGRCAKHYRAVVRGRWPLRTKTLNFALDKGMTGSGERVVRVAEGGREARTRVTGLAHAQPAELGMLSQVDALLETGRTHQIRVHLAHAGFPIAGDRKYGDFELNKKLEKRVYKRMFLHALSIEIMHPSEGRSVRLEAPLPEDFERLVPACTQEPR